jgi:hypothetical protein
MANHSRLTGRSAAGIPRCLVRRRSASAQFTMSMDLAGVAAICLSCGFAAEGVPYSIQFTGRRLREAMLCHKSLMPMSKRRTGTTGTRPCNASLGLPRLHCLPGCGDSGNIR